MMYKEKLLEKLKSRISFVQEKFVQKIAFMKALDNRSLANIKAMKPDDRAVYLTTKNEIENRIAELHNLYNVPYFAKCEVIQEKTGEKKTYLFAKHQFTEESIYSWVAPVASIRFENPGPTSYKLPNGEVRKVDSGNKNQCT